MRVSFRAPSLRSGRYTVQVTPPFLQFSEQPPIDNAINTEPEPQLTNAITYYPNSPTRDGRSLISVRAGEIHNNIDIVMLQAPGVCVSTTLVTPSMVAEGEWRSVVLSELYPRSQSRVAIGRSRISGCMKVCGVTPGSYRLTAGTRDPSGTYYLAFQPSSYLANELSGYPMHIFRLRTE